MSKRLQGAFSLALAVVSLVGLACLRPPLQRRRPALGAIDSVTGESSLSRELSPRLHFLFLAMTDVPHGYEWSRFFAGGSSGSWTVRLHCKNSTACLSGDFVKHVPAARVVPSVPTVYCTDLVSAEVQLLRDALQEDGKEHRADKFVFLSDSTLPLKPFSEVFAALTDHNESDFCIYPANQWFLWEDRTDGKRVHIASHSQFVQLNRQDALTFVKGWDAARSGKPWVQMNLRGGFGTTAWPAWKVPVLDGSRGPGAEASTKDFDGWDFCADENVPFSIIFGAIAFDPREQRRDIDGFGALWHDEKHMDLVQGRCFTYFSYYMWSMDDYALESKLADVKNSTVYNTTYEECSHPLEFGDLAAEAVQMLRDTPYLFGRKFRQDAQLQDYEGIILAPPKAAEAPKPVLHFMFLAIDAVGHASIWQRFFADAPRKTWRAWLHCKNPSACRNSGIYRQIPGIRIVKTKPTLYCNDLLTAVTQLMSEALYSTAAPPGMIEKFILVGDTTLPVKPFSEVYRTLTENDTSDFCLYPTSEWMQKRMNGSVLYAPQHHQWIVLNRPDAHMLLMQWSPTWDEDKWPDWNVSLHGASRAIARKGHLLASSFSDGDPSWACTDELAPFGILYGAFVPGADGTQHYPGLGAVRGDVAVNQGRCRTLVLWNATSTQEELKQALVDDPCTDTILPTWMHGGSDPAAFGGFSEEAMWRLRASDYLFVRKVLPNATLHGYAETVLSDAAEPPPGSARLRALRKACSSARSA